MTGLIVTVFTVILIVRDGMISPANRDWFLFKYIPSLPWYWWLIIGVVALAVLSLEGAYTVHAAEHSKLLAKHKQRVSEIRNEYRDRLDSKHLDVLVESRRIELNGGIPKPSEPVPPPPAEPNIVYESPAKVDVHRAHRGFLQQGTWRDHSGFSTHFPALVATYRNKILKDRQIGVRGHISAQLSFVSYEKAELLTTNRIAWLGTDDFTVAFGRNDPHSLVVAIFENYRLCAIQENTTDDYNNPTKTIPLNGDLQRVHVELVSESDGQIVSTTDLMLEVVRTPEFDLRLERVFSWKRRKLTEIAQAGRALVERQAANPETELEQDYIDWEAGAAWFIELHLDELFMQTFRPPPYVPPPGTNPAFARLSKSFEPVGVYNKTRAKVEALERFKNELI